MQRPPGAWPRGDTGQSRAPQDPRQRASAVRCAQPGDTARPAHQAPRPSGTVPGVPGRAKGVDSFGASRLGLRASRYVSNLMVTRRTRTTGHHSPSDEREHGSSVRLTGDEHASVPPGTPASSGAGSRGRAPCHTDLASIPASGSGPSRKAWPRHAQAPFQPQRTPLANASAGVRGRWIGRGRPPRPPCPLPSAGSPHGLTVGSRGVCPPPPSSATQACRSAGTGWWQPRRRTRGASALGGLVGALSVAEARQGRPARCVPLEVHRLRLRR